MSNYRFPTNEVNRASNTAQNKDLDEECAVQVMLDVSEATGVEGVDTVSVFSLREQRWCFPIFTSVFTHVCTGPLRGLHIEGNRITLASTSRETGAYLVKAVVLSQPLTPG